MLVIYVGDVVAQLVEHGPQDPIDSMIRGSNPSVAQEKIVTVFLSQNVVLARCRCAPPPCVHARIRTYMHVKDHVVHVRVWWIMETRKYPTCTCTPEDGIHGCPSGGGIKNGHIRYTSYGGMQKERNICNVNQALFISIVCRRV